MYLVSQRLHLYASFAHTDSSGTDVDYFHLRKCIELGIEHHSYQILAAFYSSMKLAFDRILKDYDPSIRELITGWGHTFLQNSISFIGTNASSAKILNELTEQEVELMTFAAQGLTNKNAAQLTGIPEYTIRRRYEVLLKKFEVSK